MAYAKSKDTSKNITLCETYHNQEAPIAYQSSIQRTVIVFVIVEEMNVIAILVQHVLFEICACKIVKVKLPMNYQVLKRK